MSVDNLVMLNGRLTKDVDLRFSQGGTAIANFTVAVNKPYKNQQGERESDFINCTAFGKTAENIANYFSKGVMIGVQGEYQNNNYTKEDGTKVYRDHVKVDNFSFREKRNDSDNSQQSYSNQSREDSDFKRNSDPFGQSSQIDISDDDLPF
ncbi:single-stranded DNA-binding protein [Vagococcus carniphilus]|uniref:single-stranded DNA-binding protein n=1 Tax=Vagococcus carniphilus TaxID=218144 RepID=UPI00288CC7AE|nr:single-stranded DNA-binding protein [Vagococcus carniphilus]MDT2864659.1 single-stranded DNA-binding protein [Vagococcus carniphilus]